MNNQDSFDSKLNKVIKNLPEFEPDYSVWGRIEAQFSFENKLDAVLQELPEVDYNIDTWDKIENKLELNHKTKTNTKIRKLLVYSLATAASLLLIFGISRLFISPENVKVTYSQEYVTDSNFEEMGNDNEPDPFKFLKESCAKVPDVCNTPEFKKQKELLKELETERENINEVIENYGESPELIKSLIKIENLKSEILKDMIKTINS